MAKYQVEIRRDLAPFGNRIRLIDVVVANNGSESMYASLLGTSGTETVFQFVQQLTSCEQRGAVMHIRNIGIYEPGLQVIITTSIYDIKHASIRIVFKDENSGILGIWNEENMTQQAVQ